LGDEERSTETLLVDGGMSTGATRAMVASDSAPKARIAENA